MDLSNPLLKQFKLVDITTICCRKFHRLTLFWVRATCDLKTDEKLHPKIVGTSLQPPTHHEPLEVLNERIFLWTFLSTASNVDQKQILEMDHDWKREILN